MAPGKTQAEDLNTLFAMAPPPTMLATKDNSGPALIAAHGVVPQTGNMPPQSPDSQQQWSKMSFANFNWSLYDYHPQDDGGFWQLQPGYPPSEQLPPTIPLAVTSRSPVQQNKDIEWTCLSPACPVKPFKRKMDLDRHYKQVHADMMPLPGGAMIAPPALVDDVTMMDVVAPPAVPPTAASSVPPAMAGARSPPTQDGGGKDTKEKEVFHCDYHACTRRLDGFARKDRYRQHLQDHHKEDVIKKGGKLDDEFMADRKMSKMWWRCSRCLGRVKIEDHGWECPRDQNKCEKRRREQRENIKTT